MSSTNAERRKRILARNEESIKALDRPWPIRWVMVETSHPGNVGSAARALKTMGFSDLRLVNPAYEHMAKKAEAIALSSGAFDVLEAALHYNSTLEAVSGSQWVFGLTARQREFGPPAISLPEAMELAGAAAIQNQTISFVFGTERVGLGNEDLKHCTHRVWIDANPNYASLNLAQAMMLVTYSMRQALMEALDIKSVTSDESERADPKAVAGMLEHWQAGLIAIDYLDPKNPKKLMPRLEALFARAGLHPEEIDLLRGIAKQMILHGKAR